MCDLAFVMILERNERHFLADRQAFVAASGSFHDAPDWEGVEAALLAALEAEPTVISAEQAARLRVLELL